MKISSCPYKDQWVNGKFIQWVVDIILIQEKNYLPNGEPLTRWARSLLGLVCVDVV